MGLLENLTARGFGQPILYLPMTDKATAHLNLGTGGDFVQNGLIETADRGANQDNCVASEFTIDSSNLHGNSPSSYVTQFGCTFTVAFNINISKATQNIPISFEYSADNTIYTMVYVTIPSITVHVYEGSSNQEYIIWNNYNLKVGQTHNIVISVDSWGANSICMVDGVDLGIPAASNLADARIRYDLFDTTWINSVNGSTNRMENIILGELFWDDSYINDISIFWDADLNKPINIRKVVLDNGLNPMYAMPLDASNPTKNYGRSGTLNTFGTALTGARGASEFISRSAKGDGSSGYLEKTGSLSADSQTLSFAICVNKQASNLKSILNFSDLASTTFQINCSDGIDNAVEVSGDNSSGTQVYFNRVSSSSASPVGEWAWILGSVNLSNGDNNLYYNNTSGGSPSTTIGESIGFSSFTNNRLFRNQASVFTDDEASSVYLTTDYIDFSQEANRNLFVNQLGYVRSLDEPIAKGLIPQPLFYLKFDDTSNLGIDSSGNNNHFTVNGTVTSGSDFSI